MVEFESYKLVLIAYGKALLDVLRDLQSDLKGCIEKDYSGEYKFVPTILSWIAMFFIVFLLSALSYAINKAWFLLLPAGLVLLLILWKKFNKQDETPKKEA